MVIGVPREIHRHEHRVGLTPFAAERLTQHGHDVVVEKGAGEVAHFKDRDYEQAGAKIVYSPEEAYLRADVVCRVGPVTESELGLVRPASTICAFHHLAVATKSIVERLMELEVTLIGYELIRDAEGGMPVKSPFSEMAGQMAVHLAAELLQIERGGRGVLMGSVPGVPPPTVLILGAGGVGKVAARQAHATGAHVIVLDQDMAKLADINHEFRGQVVTVLATAERLRRYTMFADVVIGAILIPGARSPLAITEPMVEAMRPGSVIIDISIDQGGCVETSRPTTLPNPTFLAHDVIHYCVPNMTASIARTASRSLANAALPYLVALAGKGVRQALRDDPGLADGVYLYRGEMVHDRAGQTLGISASPIRGLLE